MDWLIYVVALLFTVAGFVCAVSVLFSVPGGWVLAVMALMINLLDQFYRTDARVETFAWTLLGAAVVLLIVGEVIEFAAGAAGAKAGGGTRPGMWGALIGGVVGGIVGTVMFPVLIIGTLGGALVGTFVGAMVGELGHKDATTVRATLRPAAGATAGRVVGTLAKIVITFLVWLALTVDAWLG